LIRCCSTAGQAAQHWLEFLECLVLLVAALLAAAMQGSKALQALERCSSQTALLVLVLLLLLGQHQGNSLQEWGVLQLLVLQALVAVMASAALWLRCAEGFALMVT
jgi:hypothetical protein